MATSIGIENVGAIEQLEIPVPAEGGVVVLRGRNGAGKSTALEAVRSAVRGSGSLVVRDGAKKGSVEAFGAKLTVARSTRRTGEIEVHHLEGRLSIAELVDPGLKTDDAADAARIKALVALQGVEADVRLFHGIAASEMEFDSIVSPAAAKCNDLVKMAAAIRADFHRAAKVSEDRAAQLAAEAASLIPDDDGECDAFEVDEETLTQAFTTATERASTIDRERAEIARIQEAANEAQRKLDDMRYDKSSIDRELCLVQTDKDAATKERQYVMDSIAAMEKDLAKLRQDKSDAEVRIANADTECARIDAEIAVAAPLIAAIEAAKTIDGDALPSMLEGLAKAKEDASRAKTGLQQLAVIRERKARRDKGQSKAAEAKKLKDEADRLREAARATDDVLLSTIRAGKLRIDGGRLVTDTRRGVTPLSDLSFGERSTIAIEIAAENLDANGGVIVLDQEFWEGLDPMNRQHIADECRRCRVVAFTAEATADDSIIASEFGGAK